MPPFSTATAPLETAAFDYPFDPELIASHPLPQRDQSRLLIYRRKTGLISHEHFTSILNFLREGDLCVFNNTRVFPARLIAQDGQGKPVEILFLRSVTPGKWQVLIRKRGQKMGDVFSLGASVTATLSRPQNDGEAEVVIDSPATDIYAHLDRYGTVPLPPYILSKRKTPLTHSEKERYQTLYATVPGSAAAPTAGLHFTPTLLQNLGKRGIQTAWITLHIGAATFRPIRTAYLEDHHMHREWFSIPDETAETIGRVKQRGGRIVAIGTTTLRCLESSALQHETVHAMQGETDLYVMPGHTFRVVDALLTNFHLPRSTLLVLVSAFAGVEAIRHIYEEAVAQRYRFYSYGDAMLLL